MIMANLEKIKNYEERYNDLLKQLHALKDEYKYEQEKNNIEMLLLIYSSIAKIEKQTDDLLKEIYNEKLQRRMPKDE
jgi:hypothetical protein